MREFAYGAESKIGTFSDALMAEAKEKRLDGHQHEERLEAHFRVRAVKGRKIKHPNSGQDGDCGCQHGRSQ